MKLYNQKKEMEKKQTRGQKKKQDLDSRSINGDQREYTMTIETIEKDLPPTKEVVLPLIKVFAC